MYFQLARVSQANYNRGGVIYEGDDKEIRQGIKKWGVCVWGGEVCRRFLARVLARVSQANYNRGGVIYEGDDREIRQGFKKWGVCVRVWGGGRYVEDF